MARNEEKAQAMLNRFVVAKRDANRIDKSQRPYLATECKDMRDCEVYRNQIIKEMSKKVSMIQNEGLAEEKIRDLNDAINKLMREKGHWERQIKSLGGPDYFRTAPRIMNAVRAQPPSPSAPPARSTAPLSRTRVRSLRMRPRAPPRPRDRSAATRTTTPLSPRPPAPRHRRTTRRRWCLAGGIDTTARRRSSPA